MNAKLAGKSSKVKRNGDFDRGNTPKKDVGKKKKNFPETATNRKPQALP